MGYFFGGVEVIYVVVLKGYNVIMYGVVGLGLIDE